MAVRFGAATPVLSQALMDQGYQLTAGSRTDIAEADALHDAIVRENYPDLAEEVIRLNRAHRFVREGLQAVLNDPQGVFWVIRRAGHLVAFAAGAPMQIKYGPLAGQAAWDFSKLYVATNHQGRGLGRVLMDALLAEGQRQGVRQVYALTRPSYQSYPLFLKTGFRLTEGSVQYEAGIKAKYNLVELLKGLP